MDNNAHLVKVSRKELIQTLELNMRKHVDEYNRALVQFRKDAIAEIESILNEAKNGGNIKLALSENRHPPTSFEKEYKRAIARYTASVDDNIFLDETQFNQYWLDEWVWKNSVSNAFYSSKFQG